MISMVVVGELILATSEYHSISDRRTAFAYGSLTLVTACPTGELFLFWEPQERQKSL